MRVNVRRTAAGLAALALLAGACGGETDEPEEATDEGTGGDEGQAACGPDSPDLFQEGQLTVATGEPVFPPWMMDDDPANGEGFESAVVYALADEMGFTADQVAWARTGFDEAIGPGEKDYDFNIQQYSITGERDEVVDFSAPYYEVEKSLVALTDSPAASASSLADLQDVSFGAVVGTTDLAYIEEVIGVDDVAVYDDQAGLFQALQGGQIDATVFGLPGALFVTAVQVEGSTIAGILPGEPMDDGLGMLFEEGSPLVACVDAALESLRADGTLDALADEWLAGGGDIPRISE
ncbi:MAG: amino acid ABC transporter substrate-binding protein [Actinobacteria bacterium]|jgi:polar amino acid transport system substrate-binding protein|nr:amino acid ABC transporter substrate-binding protein [Actinomycetota bacterium]